MPRYVFHYKVSDCFTYLEYDAEYITDAVDMVDALDKWAEFRDELRNSTYDAISLISCDIEEEDLTKVTKWMIEG